MVSPGAYRSWLQVFRWASSDSDGVGAHFDTGVAHTVADETPHRHPRSRLGLLLAALLGVYVGVEMGLGGWLTKYMVSQRGVTLTYAGNTLSLYWMGLAAGRLALSALSHRFGETKLLIGLTAVAAIALPAALLASPPWLAVVGFSVTGAGFSGIFPIVIAIGGRTHPRDVAGITSVMITGAGIGGIVVPWMMSAIADIGGIDAGMIFYAVMGATMVVLAALIAQIMASPGQPQPAASDLRVTHPAQIG